MMTRERIEELRAKMEASRVGAMTGGAYIGALLHAAPELIDLADDALIMRDALERIDAVGHITRQGAPDNMQDLTLSLAGIAHAALSRTGADR